MLVKGSIYSRFRSWQEESAGAEGGDNGKSLTSQVLNMLIVLLVQKN